MSEETPATTDNKVGDSSNASTASTEVTNPGATAAVEATTPATTTSEPATDTGKPQVYYQTHQYECSALPQGWKRSVRQYQNCAASIRGKYKTTAYIFKGERYTTKYQLARAFSKITKNENGVDLSSFDWKNGRWIRQHHKQKKGLEQLSTELFGKGITDINFTISQPTELLKKGLPDKKKVKVLMPHGRLSAIKHNMPRPDDIPEWDFDYDTEQGINGTPIHHPTKKRHEQAHPISAYGPLQLYGVRRLAKSYMKPCYKDSGTPIKQPVLPPGMNAEIIKTPIKDENGETGPIFEPVKMDDVNLEVAREQPPDCSKILDDDLLWRQTILSLTIDGKALPSTAIWGQNQDLEERLARVPDAWIDPTQPFVKHFSISKDVIAAQAGRVRTLRNELASLYKELRDLENEKLRKEMGLPEKPANANMAT